ncbi:hypothetical protein PG987_006655 [Apiospora arundinis]
MTDAIESRTALALGAPDSLKEVTLTIPRPLPPSSVLVKVAFVGLNPSDVKMTAGGVPLGAIAGTEFSGTIVEKGDAVTATLTVGQRICGATLGYNERLEEGTGAFATYVVADAHLLLPVPDRLGLEDAATLPVAVMTAGLVLRQILGLRDGSFQTYGRGSSQDVLVYGGSTSSGLLMIQVLKHAGVKVLTTCSPHNFELTRAAGAASVFDYHDSAGVGGAIRAATEGKLGVAIDCITSPESMRICYEALGTQGGRYIALDKIPIPSHSRRSVWPQMAFAMRGFGQEVNWGGEPYTCTASQEDKDHAATWMQEAATLVEQGIIKPHRWEAVPPGGFEAVIQGLDRLKSGKLSAVKLVASLAMQCNA